jgi:lysozyme
MREIMIRYISITAVLVVILGVFNFYGYIWYNSIFTLGYEVKGLDVSHHQGLIHWQQVKEENKYQFVYIKATEGKDFTDHRFVYNWREARKQNLLTGAYHFFSMQSSGKDQAEHFKRTVPIMSNSLPPVIDIEIALYHNKNKVQNNLKTMIDELEKTYKKKPILYVTYDTYHTYIKHTMAGYRIWIRDIYKYPSIDKENWTIWQYHNRGHVDGINAFVDINVFQGSPSELLKLK